MQRVEWSGWARTNNATFDLVQALGLEEDWSGHTAYWLVWSCDHGMSDSVNGKSYVWRKKIGPAKPEQPDCFLQPWMRSISVTQENVDMPPWREASKLMLDLIKLKEWLVQGWCKYVRMYSKFSITNRKASGNCAVLAWEFSSCPVHVCTVCTRWCQDMQEEKTSIVGWAWVVYHCICFIFKCADVNPERGQPALDAKWSDNASYKVCPSSFTEP